MSYVILELHGNMPDWCMLQVITQLGQYFKYRLGQMADTICISTLSLSPSPSCRLVHRLPQQGKAPLSQTPIPTMLKVGIVGVICTAWYVTALVVCSLLWYLLHIPSQFFHLQKHKQKEETTPFGVRLQRSLVIYQAVVHLQSCMQVLVTECRQLRRELGQDSALGLQSLEAPRFSKRARQMEPEMELAADAAVHLSEMHAGHLRSVRAPL